MKNLIIRATTENDVPELIQIMTHEHVKPWQFPQHDNYEKYLIQTVNGAKYNFEGAQVEYFTVLFEDKIVGYINYNFDGNYKDGVTVIGFDLDPNFWGKGIMTNALKSHLPQFCQTKNINTVMANVFVDNKRCRALMKRLNFTKVPFSFKTWLGCLIYKTHLFSTYKIEIKNL